MSASVTLRCPKCGRVLTPDWVGDPKVGWCSPCNAWNFELAEAAGNPVKDQP